MIPTFVFCSQIIGNINIFFLCPSAANMHIYSIQNPLRRISIFQWNLSTEVLSHLSFLSLAQPRYQLSRVMSRANLAPLIAFNFRAQLTNSSIESFPIKTPFYIFKFLFSHLRLVTLNIGVMYGTMRFGPNSTKRKRKKKK